MMELPSTLPWECIGCQFCMSVIKNRHSTHMCEMKPDQCKLHRTMIARKKEEKIG